MSDLPGTLFAASGLIAYGIAFVFVVLACVFEDDALAAQPVTATPIERMCEGGHWL